MGGSTFGLLGSWNGSSRSTSWLSESSLLEALVEAPVEFGDKLLVGQLLNQLGLDGRADLNSDSRKSRPGGGARPVLGASPAPAGYLSPLPPYPPPLTQSI